MTMNKSILIHKIAERTNLKQKDCKKALEVLLETIKEQVAAGNKVQLIGFGTFEQRARMEYTSRNPQNGELITIPAHSVPIFKPGKTFKEYVNKK